MEVSPKAPLSSGKILIYLKETKEPTFTEGWNFPPGGNLASLGPALWFWCPSLCTPLHIRECWTSWVALRVKNPPANAGDVRDTGSIPGSGRSPWRRAWQPTPVFLPGQCHGQRSLASCSPWGHRLKHNWARTPQLVTLGRKLPRLPRVVIGCTSVLVSLATGLQAGVSALPLRFPHGTVTWGLVTWEARGGECALSGEVTGSQLVGLTPWLCQTEAGLLPVMAVG